MKKRFWMVKPFLLTGLAILLLVSLRTSKVCAAQEPAGLTEQEREFVRDCPTLRIAYLKDAFPLSYIDEDGNAAGITIDLLKEVAQGSGLDFEFVSLPTRDIDYNYLGENNIQLLSGVRNTPYNQKTKGLSLSEPYFESVEVLVCKKNYAYSDDRPLKVAVCIGSGTLQKMLKDLYPNFEVVHYNTVEECFEALRSGEVEGTLQNQYVVDRQLVQPRNEELASVPHKGIYEQSSISTVVIPDKPGKMDDILSDPRLIRVIDKAILQIDHEELQMIIVKYTTAMPYQVTVGEMLYQYRFTLGVIGILILVIIGIVIYDGILREKAMKKLEKATKAAEHANHAKSDFLSRMSHEIRTPMNAVIGMASLAEHSTENPIKTREYLKKITVASKHLLGIINDVLDMSAIESNKLKVASMPFDIKEVVSSATTMYYTQCKEKGITFDVLLHNVTEEMLLGDQLRVSQILLNLLSNAYKFTKTDGKITVSIHQKHLNDNMVSMRLEVKDTGIGMSEEYMQRIFQPFEQESELTAREHGGSGLGLSITQNLIQMMHGTITVKSAAGEGTCFNVELPFEIAGSQSRMLSDDIKGVKALIVDDDEDSCEYTSAVLSHMGVHYDCVASGQEALVALSKARNDEKPYDICLVDWKMAEMNGIETTRKIRKLYDDRTIVVVMSAYDVNEIQDEAEAAGVDVCVTKPVFQSTIFNILMSLSQGRLVNRNADEKEYDFTGRRVLLVDDTDFNREVGGELLELVGFQVDYAEDGEEAVEQFEASEPGTYDLIMMDVQMPRMNGYDATRRIRSSGHPQAKDIVIIAMTANAFAEDIAASLQAGMNDHISKPIITETLYQLLSHFF